MKIKVLMVIMGAVLFSGCAGGENASIEDFKDKFTSENYYLASKVYKENIKDSNFKKFANTFIENDINGKSGYLNSLNFTEIEKDLNGISTFYNSDNLVLARGKVGELKNSGVNERQELVETNNSLKETNRILEEELSKVIDEKTKLEADIIVQAKEKDENSIENQEG